MLIELLAAAGLLFYALLRCPREKSGSIVVAPSQGEIVVRVEFEPKEVEVAFADTDPCSPPSCAELHDEIYKIRILPRGFKFQYTLDSGIRTINWSARR